MAGEAGEAGGAGDNIMSCVPVKITIITAGGAERDCRSVAAELATCVFTTVHEYNCFCFFTEFISR